ncbi:MAG TPA: glycosyltransferase family 39 protein [Tepidisphaeraceae bacterium]
MSESAKPNHSSLLICLLLILIAATLRIPSLGLRGYTLDEAWSAEMASGRGSVHLHLPKDTVMPMPKFFSLGSNANVPWWRIWTNMECTHPPLYYLGLRFWTDVIGAGDAPERSFSIIAALISIVLLYDVARLYNGQSIAIWACILFALAQPQIQYARETRNYTWLIACALLAVDALIRIEKFGPSYSRLAALTIGILATPLTHYFGIGILIGLGIYALLRTRGRIRLQILAAFTIAILIFSICWGPFMWQQRALALTSDQSVNFLLDNPDTHLRWTFYRLLVLPGVLLAEPRGPALYICYIGAALYLLPLIALRRRPDLLLWICWMFGVIGVIAAFDFSRDTHHLGLIRYTLLAGPAVYVLIPAIVSRFRPWLRHSVPAIAAIYCLWALPHAYQFAVTDPKAIVAEVQSATRPNDLLLFISTGKNEWWAGGQCMLFSRYLNPQTCPVALLNAPAGPEVTTRALASPRVIGFTVNENPADYVHGLFPQTTAKFPGQGQVWVLQK